MIADDSLCTANILCGTQLHHISWKSWKLKYKLDYVYDFYDFKIYNKNCIYFNLNFPKVKEAGSFTMKCRPYCQKLVLPQDRWSLMAVVSQNKVSLYLKEVAVEKSALEE